MKIVMHKSLQIGVTVLIVTTVASAKQASDRDVPTDCTQVRCLSPCATDQTCTYYPEAQCVENEPLHGECCPTSFKWIMPGDATQAPKGTVITNCENDEPKICDYKQDAVACPKNNQVVYPDPSNECLVDALHCDIFDGTTKLAMQQSLRRRGAIRPAKIDCLDVLCLDPCESNPCDIAGAKCIRGKIRWGQCCPTSAVWQLPGGKIVRNCDPYIVDCSLVRCDNPCNHHTCNVRGAECLPIKPAPGKCCSTEVEWLLLNGKIVKDCDSIIIEPDCSMVLCRDVCRGLTCNIEGARCIPGKLEPGQCCPTYHMWRLPDGEVIKDCKPIDVKPDCSTVKCKDVCYGQTCKIRGARCIPGKPELGQCCPTYHLWELPDGEVIKECKPIMQPDCSLVRCADPCATRCDIRGAVCVRKDPQAGECCPQAVWMAEKLDVTRECMHVIEP